MGPRYQICRFVYQEPASAELECSEVSREFLLGNGSGVLARWPTGAICKLCTLFAEARGRLHRVSGRNRFLLQPGCCSCGANLWQNLGQTVLWMEVKLVFSGALRSALRV